MSETLLIHYDINNARHACWALCNERGELTGRLSSGSIDELKDAAASEALAGLPVVVLLNSYCLHITSLQLPTQNMQKMLRAIPYAIEEYIAEDIEDFHFVVARNKHNNRTAVVGIDRETLKNIIQLFQDIGLFVETIIPDALCLPAGKQGETSQWACLNHGEDCYLQTDPLTGMVYTSDVFPYVLRRAFGEEEQEAPQKLLLFSEQEHSETFDTLFDENMLAELEQKNESLEIIRVSYNQHPLVIFCGYYRQALPLNLLQHKFKAKRKSSGYWQYWKLPAALAACALVLYLGIAAFEKNRLAEQNRQMYAQIVKIYKRAFPQSRKIVNPRVQMEQKLKELKGAGGSSSNDLLFLLAESFGSLDNTGTVSIQSITYRNHRMDISLDSKNLQAIENLNRELNKNPNIRAEIVSSSSEKDRVSGNIRIEGRSSAGNSMSKSGGRG